MSAFTTDPEQRFQNDFAAVEPNHRSDDCHDGARNDAGTIALDRERWQLPERAAFFCTAIPWAQVFWVFFQVSFSAFSQSGCFRPHSSCQRACFFRLIGEGISILHITCFSIKV